MQNEKIATAAVRFWPNLIADTATAIAFMMLVVVPAILCMTEG
jgi:hypothetical protein